MTDRGLRKIWDRNDVYSSAVIRYCSADGLMYTCERCRASALVAPVDALNLDALRCCAQTGQAGTGDENVLELSTPIPRGHRLDIQLNYQVASGVTGSALKQVHLSAVLDMTAACLSSSCYEVQSRTVVASLN